MMQVFIILFVMVFNIGCARIQVEAPKEPIRVDISMRVDIYQHIQNDIDKIEDIILDSGEGGKISDNHSMLDYILSNAYAQDGLDPQVKEAALRRKNRHSQLLSLQEKGVIGENKLGLLEIINNDLTANDLIGKENQDRMIIYKILAEKNNVPIVDIQKIYTIRLQDDTPSGSFIEVLDSKSNTYEWKKK